MSEVTYGLPREAPRGSMPSQTELAKLAAEALVASPHYRNLADSHGTSSSASLTGMVGLALNIDTSPTVSATTGAAMWGIADEAHPRQGFSWPHLTPSATWDAKPGTTCAALPRLPTDQYLVFLSAGGVEDFIRPLLERIKTLAKLAMEEDDQEAIRHESLAGLLRFLYVHRQRIQTRPQLVLTPEGHLRAEWRKSKHRRIAVRFLDEARVSFVSFLPDQYDPTQIDRVGGNSSVDGFFAMTGVGVQALVW